MRIVSSSFVTTKTSFSRKKVRIIKEMQQGNLKNLKEGTPVGLGKVIKKPKSTFNVSLSWPIYFGKEHRENFISFVRIKPRRFLGKLSAGGEISILRSVQKYDSRPGNLKEVVILYFSSILSLISINRRTLQNYRTYF